MVLPSLDMHLTFLHPPQKTPPQKTGFTDIHVTTVGENEANYGLWTLPVVPRAETPDVMRTYLFEARVGGPAAAAAAGVNNE
jgi:hypothetical protein